MIQQNKKSSELLTKLTPEQEAKIPQYIQKWVDLASQPIDRSKVKDILKKIYGEEKIFIIGESLQNTIDLIKVATKGKKLEYDSQLRSQFDSQFRSQLYFQLYSQLDSQFGSQFGSQLYSQFRSQLYSQLGGRYSFSVSYYLQDFAGYYDYAKYIGVKFNEDNLQQFNDIVLNIPICVFVGNVVFICEKPQCLWEDKKLHSDTKPAIGWKDGTGIYFLYGVKFEKDLWEKVVSKKLTPKQVFNHKNIEQRMAIIKHYGNEWLLKKAKLIDKSERGNELYLLEGVFSQPAYYLKYKDTSTNRVYVSGIDPKVGKKKNADEAMSWKFKITPFEYSQLQVEA